MEETYGLTRTEMEIMEYLWKKGTTAPFRELAARQPKGTAALVVHGGTIMSLLEALEGSGQFYRWQAPNGGGYLCRWDGHRLTVEAAL